MQYVLRPRDQIEISTRENEMGALIVEIVMQVEDGAARVLHADNLLTSLTGRNLVIQRGVLVDSGQFTFRYSTSKSSQ